ncbi:MAG: aromatic ring-hydroxylating dioxygenase subunit alpha [Ignavibacteriae bacterium]|nr:aromatic ring-hydroxylating dioxygenase subunit alpha [Ignavibacteria bacterium]MBI3365210.1 aromatic ring-hydroxylating dioxygenase subunit alpha [Ignavibacteriota bacterium]
MRSIADPPDFTLENLTEAPIERSETIPSSWYTDPRMHEIDFEWIFARTWQAVGHVSRAQNPGEYITATVGGNPIIVVRGKENELRAFFNVCRHRGGPLAIDEHGTCNALQCKYHGWTYLLDGSLRGVPKWDRVDLFDKKDYGLVPVAVDRWEGLLFVHLNSAARIPVLQSTMEGIVDRIAPHSLATKKFSRRVFYDVNCNWKVYVDNYLEGYHLPHVHPELCNLLDYQQYVTETHERYSLQYSPFTGKNNVYGSREGAAFYYFLFPNFMLNILPGRLQTNIVLPLSHNRCRIIFDYYYDDIASPGALRLIENDIAYSDKIQQEDMEICGHVQHGIESVAYDKGRFSVEMEQGVYHFQCMLKKAYRQIVEQTHG